MMAMVETLPDKQQIILRLRHMEGNGATPFRAMPCSASCTSSASCLRRDDNTARPNASNSQKSF
jgi:hypothetical protein